MRALVPLLLLAGAALSQDGIEYVARRFVAPKGTHTLDARATEDGRWAFELRRAADGSVLGSGTLPQLPADVRVLDGDAAALLFERFGAIGHGDTLARLGADGTIAWRKPLGAFFDEATIARFPTSMASIWWYRTWWVDEERGRVVVVARGGLVRLADLADGTVRAAGHDVILAGVPRPEALEVAAELGLEDVRPQAERLLADAAQPWAVRLRSGVALARTGGPEPPAALFEPALDAGQPLADRLYAIGQAPALLGAAALPLLQAAARRGETSQAAARALGACDAEGMRALALLSVERKAEPGIRGYATEVLAGLDDAEASRALAAGLEMADARTAGALLRAGIAARLEGLHEEAEPFAEVLCGVLDAGTAPVEWVADHFRRHPNTAAIAALQRALRRHGRNPARRALLDEALRACSGR